jgi:hypothetical protein
VVRALDRKLFRDLLHLRGQMFAIAVVVTCGVAIVVSSRMGYESLARSQATYYADYRFADVFAQLKRAPERASATAGAASPSWAWRPAPRCAAWSTAAIAPRASRRRAWC